MEIAIAVLLALVTVAFIGRPYLQHRRSTTASKDSSCQQTSAHKGSLTSGNTSKNIPGTKQPEEARQDEIDDINQQVQKLRQKR